MEILTLAFLRENASFFRRFRTFYFRLLVEIYINIHIDKGNIYKYTYNKGNIYKYTYR